MEFEMVGFTWFRVFPSINIYLKEIQYLAGIPNLFNNAKLWLCTLFSGVWEGFLPNEAEADFLFKLWNTGNIIYISYHYFKGYC